MKKYEYVRITGSKFCGAKFEDHRTIIDQYASKGFSYVGYLPVVIAEYGKFKEIDLIFEKEE